MATSYDIILVQRNSTNTKNVEIVIPDSVDGFLGFDGNSALGLQLVQDSDVTTNALSLNKLQTTTQYKIIGRISSGTGSFEELTANNLITILNTASSTISGTVAPGNAGSFMGSFDLLFKESSLGTVTTTQTIDVTSGGNSIRYNVRATLSTSNVIFNFTNLSSTNKGMEILLILTNGGTSRNISIQKSGSTTGTSSGIDSFATVTNVPTSATGYTIFGCHWDGTIFHINKLNYA